MQRDTATQPQARDWESKLNGGNEMLASTPAAPSADGAGAASTFDQVRQPTELCIPHFDIVSAFWDAQPCAQDAFHVSGLRLPLVKRGTICFDLQTGKLHRVTKQQRTVTGRTFTSRFRGVHQTFPTKRWEAQFRRGGKPTSCDALLSLRCAVCATSCAHCSERCCASRSTDSGFSVVRYALNSLCPFVCNSCAAEHVTVAGK
jgi:hypothetical protein